MKNTRNSLSINYTVDKTDQVGYFVLKLLQDNMPVKVATGAQIYASKQDTGDIYEWPNALYKDGQIFLRAEDFKGIKQKGTYFLKVILADGEIYPSSGECVLHLQKDLADGISGIQIVQGINGTSPSLDDIKVLVDKAVAQVPTLKGDSGENGKDGLSAYQLALQTGFKGTLSEWLASLKGDKGDQGIPGPQGPQGEKGDKGDQGIPGPQGEQGPTGPEGPQGLKGDIGPQGIPGTPGENGLSAYQLAVEGGYDGSLTDWLASLKGDQGAPGAIGPQGAPGKDGANGAPGKDAPTITSVNYDNSTLTFTLSDSSTKSTPFVMPVPKDAPQITNVTLNDDQTQLIFTLSDGSKLQTNFVAPKAIAGPQGPTGPKGDVGPQGEPGKDGKDAPKITSIGLNTFPGVGSNPPKHSLTFNFSDGSSIDGPLTGITAYDIAMQEGFKGTEQDWLTSLKGPMGPQGPTGPQGPKGDGGNANIKLVDFTQPGKYVFKLSALSTIQHNMTFDKGMNLYVYLAPILKKQIDDSQPNYLIPISNPVADRRDAWDGWYNASSTTTNIEIDSFDDANAGFDDINNAPHKLMSFPNSDFIFSYSSQPDSGSERSTKSPIYPTSFIEITGKNGPSFINDLANQIGVESIARYPLKTPVDLTITLQNS